MKKIMALAMQSLHNLMSTLQEVSEFDTQDGNVEPIHEEMDLEEQQQQTTFEISEIGQAIKVASEGALTLKTMTTYRR
jgi:hypothetical protein